MSETATLITHTVDVLHIIRHPQEVIRPHFGTTLRQDSGSNVLIGGYDRRTNPRFNPIRNDLKMYMYNFT